MDARAIMDKLILKVRTVCHVADDMTTVEPEYIRSFKYERW